MNQEDVNKESRCWIADTDKIGKGQLGLTFTFSMGLICTALGLYMFWLTISTWTGINISETIAVLSGLFFFMCGLLITRGMLNLAHRARVVTISGDRVSIEFWWKIKQKDIDQPMRAIKSINHWAQAKTIRQFLSKLPYEKVMYQLNFEDNQSVVIGGNGEEIHNLHNYFKSYLIEKAAAGEL